MTIEIRKIHPDEWQMLRSVRLRSLQESPEAFSSSLTKEQAFEDKLWRQRAAGVGSCTVLALDDGNPFGMAVGLADNASDCGFLVSMWVAGNQRRGGTGKRLVQKVKEWTHQQQMNVLMLGVRDNNIPARRFFYRCGFVDYQGRKIYHPAIDSCGVVLIAHLDDSPGT